MDFFHNTCFLSTDKKRLIITLWGSARYVKDAFILRKVEATALHLLVSKGWRANEGIRHNYVMVIGHESTHWMNGLYYILALTWFSNNRVNLLSWKGRSSCSKWTASQRNDDDDSKFLATRRWPHSNLFPILILRNVTTKGPLKCLPPWFSNSDW